MTKSEIFEIAKKQSALECCCDVSDFDKPENVIAERHPVEGTRVYYEEPIAANLVSYGGNLVASVLPEARVAIEDYLKRFTWFDCFETPMLYALDQKMQKIGSRVCFMAEYLLPDPDRLSALPCKYECRVLREDAFPPLYKPEWSNALCANRKEKDRIAVGAYENGELIGLAGASEDCSSMWQIGIDVLPAYRRQGIASALTSRIAIEILKLGKVPFYCCAWSNLPSLKNALRAGFTPAWVEMTVKSREATEKFLK